MNLSFVEHAAREARGRPSRYKTDKGRFIGSPVACGRRPKNPRTGRGDPRPVGYDLDRYCVRYLTGFFIISQSPDLLSYLQLQKASQFSLSMLGLSDRK